MDSSTDGQTASAESFAQALDASTQTAEQNGLVQAVISDTEENLDYGNVDGSAPDTATIDLAVPQGVDDSTLVSEGTIENSIITPASNLVLPVRTHSDSTSNASAQSVDATHEPLSPGHVETLLGRFMALNSAHFPEISAVDIEDNSASIAEESKVILRVDGIDIIIHQPIAEKSKMFRTRLSSAWDLDQTGVVNLEGDYKIWMIIVLAMYDCTCLPKGLIREMPACALLEALVSSDFLLVSIDVQANICRMLTAHFATFKDWHKVPYNDFTVYIHEDRAMEINETWKAWRSLDKRIHNPFMEVGFGLLIQKCCPLQVYYKVEHLFDADLLRLVAKVGMHDMARAPIMYDAAWSLFVMPQVQHA